MITKKAANKTATKARVPKLRRLLRLLGACLTKREFYKDMTLEQAWRVAGETKGKGDQWWLASALTACDCGYCNKSTARLNRVFGHKFKLDMTAPPKRLPAALLKRWGGYL